MCLCSGNEEVEDWDPMASDYKSREFNSYESGSGALMQVAKNRAGETGGADITLYVSNIPVSLPKVCAPLTDKPSVLFFPTTPV